MSDNKKIAFDIGNVLVDVHLNKFIDLLKITGAINLYSEGMRFLEEIQPYQDLGLIDIKKSLLKFNLNDPASRKLIDCWNSETISFNQKMIDLIIDLQKQNYDIALLSNIGFNHAKEIRKNEVLNKLKLHFSCEVGARKPTKLFYQSFLLQYPDFKGCLFVDDIEENLKMAQNFGFQIYKFDLSSDITKINLEKEIEKLFMFIKNK